MEAIHLVSYGNVELVEGKWVEIERVQLEIEDAESAEREYSKLDPVADYRNVASLCSPASAMDGHGYYKQHAVLEDGRVRVLAYSRWDSDLEKGSREGAYGPASVFVAEYGVAIRIEEGSGDNLLEEDIAAGYVDYIYYDVFDALDSLFDGGMILLDRPFREIYRATADCVPDVLAHHYGRKDLGYVALRF